MRKQDVKVGQILAHKRGKELYNWGTASRVEVLATEGQRTPGRHTYSSSVSGTLVRFLDLKREDGSPPEKVVPNRELHTTWDEYVSERKRRDDAAREAANSRQASQLSRAARAFELDQKFQAAGIAPHSEHVFGLSRDQLTAVGYKFGDPAQYKGSETTSVFSNLHQYVEKGVTLAISAEVVYEGVLH